jgi:hypothetical protein
MSTNDSYLDAARAYADGVRVLFAPSGQEAGERGGRGPTSFTDLTERAEELLPASARLTKEAAARLALPEPAARIEAETALLAKALTDLEISGYLLEAARREEAALAWTGDRGIDRAGKGGDATEEVLKLILGEAERKPAEPERGASTPKTIPEARAVLTQRTGGTLFLISDRASSTSKTALEGLLGLGTSELIEAVGIVGMSIAQMLGQAEKITALYNLFRGFFAKAYESLLALLGPKLAKIAGEQVKNWVEQLKGGEPLGGLLERLYETKETKRALQQVIDKSPSGLTQFIMAIRAVQGLDETFRRRTGLVYKILPYTKYLNLLSAAAFPQGKLLVAVVYILLSGYVILTGADCVDAPRFKFLDRVPGVYRVVEANLVISRDSALFVRA